MATLGSQAVGAIVKLNVNGTAYNFIVVHQGLPGSLYDASCDGTWLLMKDIYESRAFGSNNNYANSDIHSYLNNTFVNLFDSDIKSVIKQVKIPYTEGDGQYGTLATGSSGLSAKVFLLSYTEAGYSGSSKAHVEGSVLSYFNGAANSKRVAYYKGDATAWWLRSPLVTSAAAGRMKVHIVQKSGYDGDEGSSNSYGVRTALVLPGELNVSSDGSVTLASGAITGSVNIGGVQRELTGEGYINVGGVLRKLSDSRVNIGGTIKSLKG
jgi:hypothetical protein